MASWRWSAKAQRLEHWHLGLERCQNGNRIIRPLPRKIGKKKADGWRGILVSLWCGKVFRINPIVNNRIDLDANLLPPDLGQPTRHSDFEERQPPRRIDQRLRAEFTGIVPLNEVNTGALRGWHLVYPLDGFPPGRHNHIGIRHVIGLDGTMPFERDHAVITTFVIVVISLFVMLPTIDVQQRFEALAIAGLFAGRRNHRHIMSSTLQEGCIDGNHTISPSGAMLGQDKCNFHGLFLLIVVSSRCSPIQETAAKVRPCFFRRWGIEKHNPTPTRSPGGDGYNQALPVPRPNRRKDYRRAGPAPAGNTETTPWFRQTPTKRHQRQMEKPKPLEAEITIGLRDNPLLSHCQEPRWTL